jgi:hypothetical protein
VLAPIRRTVLDARVRSIAVAIVCVAVFLRIVVAEWAHLLDDMELTVLLLWAAFATLAVRISAARFWPQAARAHD